MSYCGITLKKIASELNNLKGGKITKINMPNNSTIIFEIYLIKKYYLKIDINPNSYNMYLTKSPQKGNIANNFLNVLRKYLIGSKISNIFTQGLERICYINTSNINEFDEIETYTLIIELMGIHSNVFLVDEQKNILDCFKHFRKTDNIKSRNALPKYMYEYPISEKLDMLSLDFSDFENLILSLDYTLKKDSKQYFEKVIEKITSNIEGISKDFLIKYFEDISFFDTENLYNYILSCITDLENVNIYIDDTSCFFTPIHHENSSNISCYDANYDANYSLDNFLTRKYLENFLKTKKDNLLKVISSALKKEEKKLKNINKKLSDSNSKDLFKLYGELITSNLYKFNPNEKRKSICLFNYYTNSDISIDLNVKLNILDNSKFFYKKYNKLKNQELIVSKQKELVLEQIKYLETVMFEISNAFSIEDIENISIELSQQNIINTRKNIKDTRKNKKNLNNKKNINFNPISYSIGGYTILVGRNNVENDFLTLKYASKTDIWFHTKDICGSHVILKKNNPKEDVDESVLIEVCKIAAKHSKANNSSHIPVDVVQVKFIKKPNGSKPGYVIFKNNKTYVVNLD